MGYNCEYWASRYMGSLWSETTETWEDKHEDWRVVGSNPFRRRYQHARVEAEPEDVLYVVEFPSKRLDIASADSMKPSKNSYVILEADRGEDCGLIRGLTTKTRFGNLLRSQGANPSAFRIKQIYREATASDLQRLEGHRDRMKSALLYCRMQVQALGLSMTIMDCEYQFDLNKLTFFYRSTERIDFRDLVKDLYRTFKTRIWMCSVEKSRDRLLSVLLRE